MISDLLDPNPGALDGLKLLRARQHDVAVLQVLDPDELQFPFDAPALFHAMEDDRELLADPRTLRGPYLQALGAYLERARTILADNDIDYHLVDTSHPPTDALVAFFAGRARSRA